MVAGGNMHYKNLGRSGLKVSQLSYGAWVSFGNQLDVKEAKALLQCCRDHGVNFFDNAEVYANGRAEEIMGQAIRELGWRRSDLVVSTKIFWGGPGPNDKGLSRKHIVEGTRASLRRLDMEYVDVLYCHRPDAATPIEETVRAINHVIDRGWAFYWGTSEWSAQQITEAWAVANRLDLVGPIVEQPEYNLLSRHKVELEYLPLYSTYGLGLTTWSPLASGVLTGKYSRGNIPPDSRFALENYKNLASRSLVDDVLRKVNGLKPIADELGVPLSQLAIAWCASNPNVSAVITGATKESQIIENMKALDVIPLLTPDVLEKIEAVVQSKPKRPESYREMDLTMAKARPREFRRLELTDKGTEGHGGFVKHELQRECKGFIRVMSVEIHLPPNGISIHVHLNKAKAPSSPPFVILVILPVGFLPIGVVAVGGIIFRLVKQAVHPECPYRWPSHHHLTAPR
ncbi:putative voltage-gated potassium channel subunit beta [Cocos nucifera]|uniref:Probable voltage-gated potassium channel subunit beta n=1 Tax=Cocos nucifera TaxID=13894 RepID=A0A8K0N7K3_COCNU|nr:putative voltage-gated potassium channel subunit beta [Cocos nucifera]